MAKSISISGVPYPHIGQERVLKQKKRFNVVACGRRWGKTTFIVILIMLAVADNLAKGRNWDICFVGINKKNYAPVWNTIKAILKEYITEKSEQETTMRILDQFNIEFWSMEALSKSEGARGRAYRLMVVDEMGSLPGFKAVWQAILYATLDDYTGEAWFCGTPKGFNNFYEFSRFAEHKILKEEWSFYTAPSYENPNFTEKKWAMAKSQLTPEYFAQEYEAKFISLGNNLFNKDDFGLLPVLPDLKWRAQVRYWDIANSEVGSKKGDFTASVRMSAHADSPICILDRPWRMKGKWGQTYPKMKAQIMSEPNTIHLIETEGLGSIAFEFILQDMTGDLSGYNIYPADRKFTQKSKWDRANAWAMKANSKQMYIVRPETRFEEEEELLEQIGMFPHHAHDEYVDSVSGAHLGMIYLYNGFGVGRNPFDTASSEAEALAINEQAGVLDWQSNAAEREKAREAAGLIKYADLISVYGEVI